MYLSFGKIIRLTAYAFLSTAMLTACGGGNNSPSRDSGSSSSSGGSGTPPPPTTVAANLTCFADATAIPSASGLPSVNSGPRPGPDILYADATIAPPLTNDPNSPFVAEPLLVQGQEAYVNGEYLYQDFIYDDYGSDVDNDDFNEVPVTVGNSDLNGLEPRVGDIDYPTDFARFAGNAADLLEFRVTQNDNGNFVYRISLNSLVENDTTIVAIVFDMDNNNLTGTSTLNRDPNADFSGTDQAIFLWGVGAEHVSYGVVNNTITALTINTDLARNQMTVEVPAGLHNPSGTVGVTVVAGLYNANNGGWLMPLNTGPTDTMPGVISSTNQGAGGSQFDPNPSGIFNIGFRFDEPAYSLNNPVDTFQSERIRSKSPTDYENAINYDDIVNGVNRTTVPATGTQIRIYASSFTLDQQGERCSTPHAGLDAILSCEGRDLAPNDPNYLGQLQPYSLYIPSSYDGSQAHPMHWAFHSNAQEHTQYNGSQYVQQIGEDYDAFVPTPLGRGPRNWYDGPAEADVFEIWADMARHFNIDSNRVATTGYSMGGYASYRLGALYPDLFGKAFTQVGPPGEGIWVPGSAPTEGYSTLTNLILENTRHLPYLDIAAVQDELVPYPGPQAQHLGNAAVGRTGFQQLGYRFHFVSVNTAEHYTLFLLDDYAPFAEFLSDVAIQRNPYHVTYSTMPAEDTPEYDIVHDHAYWVSGLQLADSSDNGNLPAKGTIDAFSHACGRGVPTPVAGADAGQIAGLSYNEINQTWATPASIPAENKLTISLNNLTAANIDLSRAGLDANAPIMLDISSDQAATLTFTSHLGGNLSSRDVTVTTGTQSITLSP